MLQKKSVEKIKTHIYVQTFFFLRLCRLWENVEIYWKVWQATWQYGGSAYTLGTKGYKRTLGISTEGALQLLSAPSVSFWQQTTICPVSPRELVVELHPLNWARAQTVGRISDKEEIRENAIRELRAITESVFQEAFQQWKKRCERCVASRGDCFEGDSA
jgi:hypothetical protein